MVMKPEPLQEGVDSLKKEGEANGERPPRVVLMSPQGVPFDQPTANRLSRLPSVLIVCGHYEGVDERFIRHSVDEEISIGDFVLTGGELAAMVVIDAVVRLLPGALGHPGSAAGDSFGTGTGGILQGPVYTRPRVWKDLPVPDVLTSGDHARIAILAAAAGARTHQVSPAGPSRRLAVATARSSKKSSISAWAKC